MKQTAVEWLLEQMKDDRFLSAFEKEINQAKELEKQQMEACAIFFTNYAMDRIEGLTEINGERQFEQYYDETYKNERDN